MKEDNTLITKACSFYVSEFHLVTMLLPHINRAINSRIKVTTILEKDEEEKIKTLLEKLNLKDENKIIDIGWKRKAINNINLDDILEGAKEEQEVEIIVAGTLEYIDRINETIEEYDNPQNCKIKIINCYFIEDVKDIKTILDNHEIVLNTAGEKTVEEFKLNII